MRRGRRQAGRQAGVCRPTKHVCGSSLPKFKPACQFAYPFMLWQPLHDVPPNLPAYSTWSHRCSGVWAPQLCACS
jgi:hypothetical protein